MSKHLIHIVSDNRWTGVSRYALDICRHFKSEGWDVTAMTRDAQAVDSLFRKAGIRLIHSPVGDMFALSSALSLKKYILGLDSEPVVVHAHGFRNAFTALLARKLSGRKDVKVVVTRHKVKRGIDSWLFRRIYRNVDAMIFVSHIAATRFLSAWHGRELPFSGEKIHVIHNSLYLDKNEGEVEIPRHPVTAMFHGPIAPGKGVEVLIDAMSLLRGSRIRLKIVGSGDPDYVDRLRRRALTRGVMEMIDWKKHTDNALLLIPECDFGVLPSSAEEAFGLANIEYMACGKPQVCSSSGAQPEYITDGREGFLVPPANPGALADAMKKLGADPELRQRMGQRAAESFDSNLSWPHFVSRLAPIYGIRKEELGKRN